MSLDIYDIVIIGGGTAGLVLASRLSEDANLSVAVIESGPDRLTDPKVLTPAQWPLLSNSPLDWAFPTVAQEGLGGKLLTVPQGRLLGGSSGINSFLFTPTSKSNVDAWAGLGNNGWDYDSFADAVRKAYTFHSASGGVQGSGPIQLAAQGSSEPEGAWTKAWIDALELLGFPRQDPFSGHVCGTFPNPESIFPDTKQRCFSENAYLQPARNRTNLSVLTETTVLRILLNRTDPKHILAEGVQVLAKDGTTRTLKARKEVILSAGTINSPRILELSGIGNAAHLASLGIDVAVDNPNVGENLQNHVFTGVVFEVRDEAATLDPFFRAEPQALAAAGAAFAQNLTGPITSSSILASAQLPFPGIRTRESQEDLKHLLKKCLNCKTEYGESGAFDAAHEAYVKKVLEDPNGASANYVIGPAYTEFESADESFRAPGNHFTIAVMLSHPLSRGSVHLTSGDAKNANSSAGVAVDPRYLTHPLDLEILARHIRFAEQEIGRSEPLAKFFKPRAPRFETLDKAKEYVKRTAKGSHHYTGTCPMMPRKLGGVVDEKLRVYGVANLRVVDASVVPIEPRANTQAVVYGIAEMGVKIIREHLSSKQSAGD
ncbi:L-sorbose 1-dehydrogenase [Cladorrhinum sp. PSN332]|nr:L-sorbose 1-dehydrogenase [Cladorrhinum sp. PSN332]